MRLACLQAEWRNARGHGSSALARTPCLMLDACCRRADKDKTIDTSTAGRRFKRHAAVPLGSWQGSMSMPMSMEDGGEAGGWMLPVNSNFAQRPCSWRVEGVPRRLPITQRGPFRLGNGLDGAPPSLFWHSPSSNSRAGAGWNLAQAPPAVSTCQSGFQQFFSAARVCANVSRCPIDAPPLCQFQPQARSSLFAPSTSASHSIQIVWAEHPSPDQARRAGPLAAWHTAHPGSICTRPAFAISGASSRAR